MKNILLLLIVFAGFFAHAQAQTQNQQSRDIRITAGMRSDSADSESPGIATEGKANFQGGGIVMLPASDNIFYRTGLLYKARSFEVKSASTILVDAHLSYFEIPAGVEFKVNESIGIFGGAAIEFNISKNCGGTRGCSGVRTLPYGLQIGGAFDVIKKFTVEVYYEQQLAILADEITNSRAIVGQLLIGF